MNFFIRLFSVFLSIRQAALAHPEVQKVLKRHQRFFSFFRNRLDRTLFSGLPMTILSIIFLYVFFLFLGTIFDVIFAEKIVNADVRIVNLFAYFRTPRLTAIFVWITFLGKWQIIGGFITAVSIILWIWKKRDYIIYFWLALFVGEILAYFGKLATHRIRPDNPVYFEDSFSFPSGHSVVAIIFYGFLGYFLIRKLAGWKQKAGIFFVCIIVIFAIGLSRLYLGVHYLSDVFGGYLLGFLVLLATIMVYEWRRGKKISANNNFFVATPFVKIATIIVCIAAVLGYIGFTLQFWPIIEKFSATAPYPHLENQSQARWLLDICWNS